MKLLKEFLQIVKIVAPSRYEEPVRELLEKKLEKLMDFVFVDHYGNLLATKKCGTGEGAKVLLSAHMDTVSNIAHDRQIVYDKNKRNVYSTKGVLGADDRAGITIILQALRRIPANFNGTINVAFSVEEEIGCVGAGQIDPLWIKENDLAIVVDRRGSRDIVTGTWGTPFCSEEVGEFFESLVPDQEWTATEGGISDALEFSGHGVNSVNLSAGYFNEHTEDEYLHIPYCYDTLNLVLEALANINNHYMDWSGVPEPSKSKYTYSNNYKWKSLWKSDAIINSINGRIDLYFEEYGGLTLEQSGNVIYLDHDDVDKLLNNIHYYDYLVQSGDL